MEYRKIVIICLCVPLLIACCNQNNSSNLQQSIYTDTVYISKCDSIIYELPEKATDAILEMIKNKNVSGCGLGVNYNDEGEARYSFAFSYDDKSFSSKRDTILLQKTNIFLNLKGKMFPVITEFDNVFSNIPRTSFPINDFNFCYVEVDVHGNVVGGFAY